MAAKLPAGWKTGQGGWKVKPTLGANWEVGKGSNGLFYARKKGSTGSGSGGAADKPDQQALPDGWGTDRTGISGSWNSKPNLNSDNFEIEKNAAGKYFARPITELTGLDPWMKQAVAKYDADTAARSAQMSNAQAQGIQAASTIANANSQSLADMQKLMTSSQQSNALGGVSTGGGPATAQTTNPEAAAVAVQAGSAARLAGAQAVENAAHSAAYAPSVAASALRTAQQNNEAEASANHSKLVSAFQTAVVGAKTAKNKAIADTYNAQARILAASIAAGAKLSAAQLSAATSMSMNNADNATSIANTQTTTGARTTSNAAKAANTWLSGIAKRVDGTQSVTVGDDNKTSVTTTGGGADPMQIIREGLQRKVPMGSVLSTLLGTTGADTVKKNARQIALLMKQHGIPNATIRKTIQKQLGVDVGGLGGLAGPVVGG
jgi:hypothetical protein